MNKENASLHIRGALTAALSSLLLIGCASTPATPGQAVHERSQQYWQARITGNSDAAYAMTTPSYRKLRTAAQYRSQQGASAAIQDAMVSNVQCESARCVVRVQLKVKPPVPGMELTPVNMYANEVWLLEEGQWWLHQQL